VARGSVRPGAGRPRKPPLPASEVLELLKGIRRAQRAQDERVSEVLRAEHTPMILRRLTAIERVLGLTKLYRSPGGYTHRRPLGRNPEETDAAIG